MKKISVLLVDDHTVVRQGLRALLRPEEDIEVIGEAENGRLAVQMVRKSPPDVVVMDVAMPLLNGLEATRQILKMAPSTKVLVLTSYGDDECVQQLTEAGVSGYLLKQTAANDLLKAIREVRKGNAFFSPTIAKRLRDQCREAFANGQPVKRNIELTSREAEVLQLIAEGFSNKQIAAGSCLPAPKLSMSRTFWRSTMKLAASNASDIVMASNFNSAAIFWFKLSSPNFFSSSAGRSTTGPPL